MIVLPLYFFVLEKAKLVKVAALVTSLMWLKSVNFHSFDVGLIRILCFS